MPSINRRTLLALGLLATTPVTARLGEPTAWAELSANENPWGPGPLAREAIRAAIAEGGRYGMGALRALTQSLATYEQIETTHLAIGSGSGELLHMAALRWARTGRVVCASPTYNQLMAYARKLGASIDAVPLNRELAHDLPAMAAKIDSSTGLVYICNPNNPTGTVVNSESLAEFCRTHAKSACVVVDEAYIDLIEPGATESMSALAATTPNILVLRTFSKTHGLAGLRVGYAIGHPETIQELKSLQMAFPNNLGLEAARASLKDETFLSDCRQKIQSARQQLQSHCQKLGFEHSDSHGNFIFVRTGLPHSQVASHMAEHRIRVGRPFAPREDYCRISVGTETETARLIQAFTDLKQKS